MRGIRPVIATAACVIASVAWVPAADARPQPGPGTHSAGGAAARHFGATSARRLDPATRQLTSGHRPGHRNSALAVPLDSSPQIVRLDLRTRTAYVTSDEGKISVVDAGRCNAERHSGCARPIATLPGGGGGADLAVNVATRTLYVTSSVNDTGGIVSVYDVAHCHAGDTAGCGPAIATVPVGDIPLGLALDRDTGTLYAGNVANRLDVLDVRSCRRGRVSGCASAVVGSVTGDGPAFPLLDRAHDTVYVPANGLEADGSGNQVLVLDTRHCRAADASGCGAPTARMQAGGGAVLALLARTSHTLYVENQGDATVSVLDIAHCTGADHSGCAQPPTNVPVGANPSGGLIKTTNGGVYVGNSESDTLSVFDARSCHAGHTAGCPTSPPRTLRTGQAPFWEAYDPVSDTIFVPDHVDGTLEVVDPDRCGTEHHRGCRRLLPTIPGDGQQLADDGVHTWYGRDADGNLTLTDTRVCTARHARRCPGAAIHTSLSTNDFDFPVADDGTHTLFVPLVDFDTGKSSVAVIDTRTCNASAHTDCSPVATIPVPNFLAVLEINKTTHTVYATTQDASSLQVIDGVHCNALRQTACSGPAGEVLLAGRVFGLAPDPATNSVYVTEFGDDFRGSTVYIVDGRHCEATDVSGCSRVPARFTSGAAPLDVVIDDPEHSFYVLNNGDGDVDGEVAVYDNRTCNAVVTGGCSHSAARFMVGRAPFRGVIDPVTQRVFVVDFVHAALTEFDARACNATHPRGCRDHELDTVDLPGHLAIDVATHSLFAVGFLYGNSAYLDTRRDPGRHDRGA